MDKKFPKQIPVFPLSGVKQEAVQKLKKMLKPSGKIYITINSVSHKRAVINR